MSVNAVKFSIETHAAWAPGIETADAWQSWAQSDCVITGDSEPGVRAMPAMMRRRAAFLGKMALEVAYQCLGERTGIPTIFCSRHGEVSRSVDLLSDLANGVMLSPTSFGLSVHNATGGLFSIARKDQASSIALAAGQSSVEHAVIEACGLLADGESAVLLVVYDCPLPTIYADFEDVTEQPHAWAWLMQAPVDDAVSLSWSASQDAASVNKASMPAGLEILRFHLRRDGQLQRTCDGRQWNWTRDV